MVHLLVKDNSKAAKEFLQAVKAFSFVEFATPSRYNAETEKRIKNARSGKGIIRANNATELIKMLNS